MSTTGKKNLEDYGPGCNWWCRRTRDVRDVVAAVGVGTGVAGPAGGVIGGLIALGNILLKGEFDAFAGSYNFTSNEESILDSWYYNYYEKFVESITKTVEISFVGAVLNFKKIAFANSILSKINAIRYANILNSTNGLSETAKGIRMKLVEDFINVVEIAVKNEMAKHTTYEIKAVDINVSAISGMTSAVFLKGCPQYVLKSGNSNNSSDTTNSSEPIDLELEDNTNNQIPNEPIENTNGGVVTPSKKKSSFSYGKGVLVLLGSWIGYQLLK
jgi:hypothetical protein